MAIVFSADVKGQSSMRHFGQFLGNYAHLQEENSVHWEASSNSL